MALVYEIFFFFASLATEISKPQRNKMLCVCEVTISQACAL